MGSEKLRANKTTRARSVYFERALLTSPAYFSLGGKAPQVLGLFLARRVMAKSKTKYLAWSITNNGKIEFTYIEAEDKWGLSRSVFHRAVNQLVERGFIDVTFRGSGICGSANQYAISERWENWGTGKFEPAKMPPKNNRGGFAKGHAPYGKRPSLTVLRTGTDGDL
jgi:hypothetical protein